MKRLGKKLARVRKETADLRDAFKDDHPSCWCCGADMTLHHISGRGLLHECRENYAALCGLHHDLIQSQTKFYPHVYRLKKLHDRKFYNRSLLNTLRGRHPNAIEEYEVDNADLTLLRQ